MNARGMGHAGCHSPERAGPFFYDASCRSNAISRVLPFLLFLAIGTAVTNSAGAEIQFEFSMVVVRSLAETMWSFPECLNRSVGTKSIHRRFVALGTIRSIGKSVQILTDARQLPIRLQRTQHASASSTVPCDNSITGWETRMMHSRFLPEYSGLFRNLSPQV